MDDRPNVVLDKALDLGYAPTYEECEEISGTLGDLCEDTQAVRAGLERMGIPRRQRHSEQA